MREVLEVEEIAYNQSEEQRTADTEWTYSELESNVYDVVFKMKGELDKYKEKAKHRVFYNESLTYVDYVADIIKDSEDLVDRYNLELSKHRGDNTFGIHWFDEWVQIKVRQLLKAEYVR